MTLLSVFVNSDYELRSGWRFAAYSAIFVVLYVVWAMALGMIVGWIFPALLPPAPGGLRALGLFAVATFFPALGALVVMAHLVDHVPLTVFGVSLHEQWLRDLGAGIAVAAGMLGLTLAGSFAFGNVRMEWGSVSSFPLAGATLAVLAVAAMNEELLFRGYPLQVLMKGIGPWGATLLISSVFGLVHIANPEATTWSVLNTILAGVLLSLAYWKTRSLWLPYGIHIGWNAGLAVLLGFPVSGLQTASLLRTHVSGPQMILGGGYGPEDGMLGTLIFGLGTLLVYRMRRVGVSPEMRAMLASHAGKVYVKEL